MRVFEEKIRQKISTEQLKDIGDIVVSIGAYSIVGFLGMFFMLNLLRGNILGNWWTVIMNVLGAGCLYYLSNDFLQFLIREIKHKQR